MNRRRLLLFLLALCCPFAALAQHGLPVIACFGDSLTAGYGAAPGHAYPDYLQQALHARRLRYRVVNLGVSGNTTKDGVARLKDMTALHPAVVIVEFGGNDGLRGLPLADTRKNLDQMVSTLQKSGTKVLLAGITLPPNYGPDYIQPFDRIYTDLAKKYKVPLMPFLLKNVYKVPGWMQADGIHATAPGNRQVAEDLMPLLLPLLAR